MPHHTFPTENEKAFSFKNMEIRSPSFKENEFIPERFTCDGLNCSPSLEIDHIPVESECLAIIMDDPDAPNGTWVHWVLWNIPVTHHLSEGYSRGVQGMNDFGNSIYGGPCPPNGTHRYFFKIYALNCKLDLKPNSDKIDLEKAMSDHIIGFGELIGLYKRK